MFVVLLMITIICAVLVTVYYCTVLMVLPVVHHSDIVLLGSHLIVKSVSESVVQ